MTRGAAPTLSLLEHSNSDVKSEECQSESHGGQNGDDDDDNHHGDNDVGDPQAALSPQSSGDHVLGHYNLQHGAFTVTTRSNWCAAPPQQLELVDHSFACASNLYANPYYGGMMMASYGPQPLVHPHLVGLHHTRMPLPLEVTEEPVYVNAKQYHGILRRRRSRAKAELEQKLIKVRKPYLHESRHQHAMRRLRGSGGRFAKKVDSDASNQPAEEKGISSSNGQHNEKGSQGDGTHLAQKYTNGGICPGEPWGTIASKQPPQRALVMQ